MAEEVDHIHGDGGSKPEDGTDFQDGGYPDPEEFDWFWTEVPSAINDHKGYIEGFIDGTYTISEATNSQNLAGNSLTSVRAHDHSTLTNLGSDDHHAKTDSLSEIADADPVAIVLDTLANFSSSQQGRLLVSTDNNGIYFDTGSGLELIAEHPSNIGSTELGFDPLTQSDASDFVSTSGDTMTGDLNMEGTVDANNANGRVVLPVGTDKYDT